MFSMTSEAAAFCGKTAIHVIPITNPPTLKAVSLKLVPNMPEKSKGKPQDVFSVAVNLSESSRWLVATDSLKNVYLWEYSFITLEWTLFGSWVMDKRLVILQMDRDETCIVMIDKTGDVYVSLIGSKRVSAPKKIMGHTSLIMDVALSRDNLSIVTCDRDEKIRISSFPMAFQILGYALGHEAAVVNISLLNDDLNLVSASADGYIKIWRFGSKGPFDHKALGTWNVLDILNLNSCLLPYPRPMQELVRMKATDFENRVFIAVLISGHPLLTVFELDPIGMTLRMALEDGLDHDVVDFVWVDNSLLYVHCPERGSLRKYIIPSGLPIFKDFTFNMILAPPTLIDIAGFGACYRPNMAPLMKRHLPEPLYPPSEASSSRSSTPATIPGRMPPPSPSTTTTTYPSHPSLSLDSGMSGSGSGSSSPGGGWIAGGGVPLAPPSSKLAKGDN